MMPGQRLEECVKCGDYTGKAGPGDGSLYCERDDKGPYCEGCYKIHTQEECRSIDGSER
jgi:hypothetical protein